MACYALTSIVSRDTIIFRAGGLPGLAGENVASGLGCFFHRMKELIHTLNPNKL